MEHPTPRVQIIVPVYNAEAVLSRCLDSLLAQTYENWQALLINDASGDGSGEILRQYASRDARFVPVNRPENGGAAAARNTGLAMLDAAYTAFLDADDYLESTFLQKTVEKALAADADIVQARFVYDYPDGRRITPAGAFKEDVTCEGRGLRKVYWRMLTGINMNHVCIKLIRTPLLAGLTFDGTLRTAEDLDLIMRVLTGVRRYCFIDEVLYHYCRQENSLTGKGLPFAVKLESNRRVAKRMLLLLKDYGIDTLPYRLLTRLRPYTMVASKAIRIIGEKLGKK